MIPEQNAAGSGGNMATTMARRLLKGTLLLTITGFITRVLGFFYRIYLADLLGAHYLGIYQLIFPVYAICFTIYGAGIRLHSPK